MVVYSPVIETEETPWLPVLVQEGQTIQGVVAELQAEKSFYDYIYQNFRSKIKSGKRLKAPFYLLYLWETLGYECTIATVVRESDPIYRFTDASVRRHVKELSICMREVFQLTVTVGQDDRIRFADLYSLTRLQQATENFMRTKFDNFLCHAESLSVQGVDVKKLLMTGEKQDQWGRVQRLLSAG